MLPKCDAAHIPRPRAPRLGAVVLSAIPKGILRRLSRWEFQLRARLPTLRRKLKGGENVDIVIAQMIVTGVLLFGFAAEFLLGHFSGK